MARGSAPTDTADPRTRVIAIFFTLLLLGSALPAAAAGTTHTDVTAANETTANPTTTANATAATETNTTETTTTNTTIPTTTTTTTTNTTTPTTTTTNTTNTTTPTPNATAPETTTNVTAEGTATAEATTTDQIRSVEIVPVADPDGDGYAAAFELRIRADTSFDDTDTFGNNPGEPYFEVEIDGEEAAQTGIVDRSADYAATLTLSAEALREFDRGTHEVTVELWDRDDDFDDTDLGNDDRTSDWTGTLRYEPPATLDANASRTATVVGSPVSLRVPGGYDGAVEWTLSDAPSESTASVRSHYRQTATLRPDAAGTYTVEVTPANGSSGASATVTVTARPSSRLDLLRRYAPRVHFHDDESYFPTRYEAFVYNAALEDAFADDTPKPTMFDLAGRSSDWELDLKGTEAEYREYDDRYPPTIYGSVHRDVSFRDRSYTAVTYWLFYVFDPKRPDGGASLVSHQSDTETVTLLVNESGPQWVGASQHYGGELREWTKVSASDTHLKLYPALGAHSNYLRNTSAYPESGIPIQWQFLLDNSSTSIVPITSLAYQDRTGGGPVWTSDGSTGTDYQLVPLTGNETWATYQGHVGAGKLPMHRTRWTNPSEWLRTVPADEEQIAGSLDVADWTLRRDGVAATATVTNTGAKPHPFWAVLEAKPVGESWSSDAVTELGTRRVRVGTDAETDVTVAAAPPNATGEWNVRLRLLGYAPNRSEPEDRLGEPVVAADTLRTECERRIGRAVAGDDGRIDLTEIQRAIQWWATDQPVPDTDGARLDLRTIQRLISLWAQDEPVSCSA